MAIYGISDLHLSLADPKPMDIFNPVWKDHADKIRKNWDDIVKPTDIVLLPGDLSWALRLSEAMPDLQFLLARPGKKVLTRGNHDYWWQRSATNRMQRTINRTITFIQGNSVVFNGVGITGTRGWRPDWELSVDGSAPYGQSGQNPEEGQADRILKRELQYLENGLRSIPADVTCKIAMLHFPPFDEQLQPNEFAHLLSKYKVDILVYGHIHLGLGRWREGDVEGVQYRIVSADIVNFIPQLIVP